MAEAANLACFPEDAYRICVLSGAEAQLRKSQLLTLRQCEKVLAQCQREARDALDMHHKFRKLELAARVVLVACDVAVMALEEATGPAGMAVSKVYDSGKLAVNAFTGDITARDGIMMLAQNKATIAEYVAKGAGANKAAKAISAAKNLVAISEQLWNQVTGARNGIGGDEGIESALRTVTAQLERIRIQIGMLEAELANC